MAAKQERFSVVIIGSGSGGITAAKFAAQLGANAALIEANHVGGDCTWTGCVPSKALIKCAKMAHAARTAEHYGVTGVSASDIKVDMKKVHSFVHGSIGEVYKHETPEVFEEQGIRVFLGRAEFVSDHEIKITPSDIPDNKLKEPTTIYAERVVICTGAHTVIPDFLKESGVPYLTYEEIFDVQELPESMIFVGGGPIGAEIAQAYARFGTKVTMVARTLLPKEDKDAQEIMAKVFAKEGIKIVHERMAAVRKGPDDSVVVTTDKGTELSASKLFVALGRVPTVEGLGLETAGVKFDTKNGIIANSKLQTSVKHIYAAGDCIGSQQFTHYAGWQAFMAVRNFILPSHDSGVSEIVPRATFTDPEVAAVGMSEAEFLAHYGEKGGKVSKRTLDHVDRAVCEGEQEAGFFKIFYTADQKIKGASICCQRAGDIINEVAVAMQNGLKMSQVGRAIHAYPSFGFAVQQMASDVAVDALFHGFTGTLVNLLKKT